MVYLQYRPDLPYPVIVRELPEYTRSHALFDGRGVAAFCEAGPFVMTIDGIACYGSVTIGRAGRGGKILPLEWWEAAEYEENGLEERIRK